MFLPLTPASISWHTGSRLTSVFKIGSPRGFEDFFVEYGIEATTRSNPPADVPMPDVQKAMRLAQRYLVEFDLEAIPL